MAKRGMAEASSPKTVQAPSSGHAPSKQEPPANNLEESSLPQVAIHKPQKQPLHPSHQCPSPTPNTLLFKVKAPTKNK